MSNKVKRNILLTLTILSFIFTISTINNIVVCIFAMAITIVLGINTRKAITICIEEQSEQDSDLDEEDDDPVVEKMIKNSNTKKCKYCMSDIDVDAKICPHCRKNQPVNLNAGGVIIVLLLIFVPAIYIAISISDKEKKQVEYENDYSSYSELNLLDVVNAKSENLSNAVSTYEGNTYIYTAEVYSVGESSFTVIVYRNDIGYEFDVYYAKSQKDKVNTLRKGNTVRFYGEMDELSPLFGYAYIDNAVIISIN